MQVKSVDKRKILVLVGSPQTEVCSIGAFARQEAKAFSNAGFQVRVVEPLEKSFPDYTPINKECFEPDVVFFHAPALFDRKSPLNPFISLIKTRKTFPKTHIVSIVHEFSEAPFHWRLRQYALLKMSRGVVVNSKADADLLMASFPQLVRAPLGPTLYLDGRPDERKLVEERKKLSASFNLPLDQKWILHPGLLTPGKGIESLSRLSEILPQDAIMILMGGLGPKARDLSFAGNLLGKLENKFKERLVFLENVKDDVFKYFLFASDLVVLPYEVGVSERRSSFLSAMACAANVFVTTGCYSKELDLGGTGIFSLDVSNWGQFENKEMCKKLFQQALIPAFERRELNFQWAQNRSWKKRMSLLEEAFLK